MTSCPGGIDLVNLVNVYADMLKLNTITSLKTQKSLDMSLSSNEKCISEPKWMDRVSDPSARRCLVLGMRFRRSASSVKGLLVARIHKIDLRRGNQADEKETCQHGSSFRVKGHPPRSPIYLVIGCGRLDSRSSSPDASG